MAIVMLMLFKYLIYVLYMTEDINLIQFLSLFFWALNLVHLQWTLLVYEFPLGTSKTFLCFMSVPPIQIVPPAGVQLPQIQFVINWMSLEVKLSHLSQMWYYFTTLLQGVLINYLSIFYLFVLVVYVSCVSCSLSVVICVCMLCCFCNWPSGSALGTLINLNWI
jgi:hypothetical protein